MTRKTLDRIDTMVAHTVGGCHTEVVYRQKRICIYPDQKTGEFAADLFPVKYKLTQLTAQGYSTLTNGNTGMQVIDLTNRLTSDTLRNNGVEVVYNDTFRHVYHSPVSISLRQLQYGMEQGYLGIEKTYLTDFDSVAHIQDMVCKNALGEYEYLFGKPVFNEGKYSFRITAHEDYYYKWQPHAGRTRPSDVAWRQDTDIQRHAFREGDTVQRVGRQRTDANRTASRLSHLHPAGR